MAGLKLLLLLQLYPAAAFASAVVALSTCHHMLCPNSSPAQCRRTGCPLLLSNAPLGHTLYMPA